MKYINTTSNNIFAQVNGQTVIVAPGAEIQGSEALASFGLTRKEVKKAKPPVAPKKKKAKPPVAPIKKKAKPPVAPIKKKAKPAVILKEEEPILNPEFVKPNELSETDKTED